jgi:ABC-type transport system involved in multi-copper enzyme maturation permease subunit
MSFDLPHLTPARPAGRIPGLLALLQAHFLVLRKRTLVKVLLAIYLGLMALQFFAPIALLRIAPQLGDVVNADTRLALEQTVQLPSAFATIFGQINGVGGLLLMIIAGAFVGGDYGWGTQRALLARQPGRGRFQAAKFAALAVLAAAWVLISLPAGMACAALAATLLGAPQSVGGADLALAARGMLIAWLGLLPYLALATSWAVIGQSAVAGITGSLGYWVLEIGFGAATIFQILGDAGQTIYNFTLAQSVGAWTDLTRRAFNLDVGRAFGQLGFSFPSLLQASLMLLIYSLIFAGAARWGMRRNIPQRM